MNNINFAASLLSICTLFLVGIITVTIDAQQQQPPEKQQILINSTDSIKNLTAFGQTDDPNYPEFYPPRYLFDNLENSFSFWTQQGKAGVDLELKQKLNKPLCSVEIGVLPPQNTPFSFIVNNKIFNGTLNKQQTQLNLGDIDKNTCIPDVSKLSLRINPSNAETWTTLSEVKLFTAIKSPTQPPPIEGNATSIVISNSKVQMDLNDSEVIINGIKVDTNKLLQQQQEQQQEQEEQDREEQEQAEQEAKDNNKNKEKDQEEDNKN